MSSSRFEDKVAIVTGGGRNVGRAVARRFVEEGARVAVVDLDPGRGKSVADELESARAGSAAFFQCDVSSSEDVQRMVGQVVDAFGGVDVLVNNVAISDRGHTVLDLDEDLWHRVLAVTLDSVFLCSKYVGRRMVSQGRGGAIVNIGSTSGLRGRRNATAYSAAKGAVLNLSRSLAGQLGQYGIRVNTVTPNKVGSPVGEDEEPADRKRVNLLGRGAVPADIANAVAFVASGEAGFVTAADLLVDGGSLYGGAG
ncbi:MAG: glucose 1-dehydrogenase [Propionibacteriales bacterium]|nr:glucose 1-dehydrogenase [Propionibacteriales bacterium]